TLAAAGALAAGANDYPIAVRRARVPSMSSRTVGAGAFELRGLLQPAQRQGKPDREPVGLVRQLLLQRGHRDPSPVFDLFAVGYRIAGADPDEDVIQFVLRQAVGERGAVDEAERVLERARNPHLFEESPAGRA